MFVYAEIAKKTYPKNKQSIESCLIVMKLQGKLFQDKVKSKEVCYFQENIRKNISEPRKLLYCQENTKKTTWETN